jgi:hypothetical protein
VGRLVEVGGFDADFYGGGDRVARQQHRSEQRLLGFEVVRRNSPATGALPHRF